MAAPPGFDPSATVLPDPGASTAPMHIMRGGARGGVMFSAEEEEILSQYGLAAGGIIADKIDAPTKAAFLTQIKSGACGKGTGDLVILQKDCWAVVKVIRALIQSSMRGGQRGGKRDGQRGGGFLDTLRGLVGSKKVAPMPMAAATSGANNTTPLWKTQRTLNFKDEVQKLIPKLRAELTSASPKTVLDRYTAQIDTLSNTNLYKAEKDASVFNGATLVLMNEMKKQRKMDVFRLLRDFGLDMVQKRKQYTSRLLGGNAENWSAENAVLADLEAEAHIGELTNSNLIELDPEVVALAEAGEDEEENSDDNSRMNTGARNNSGRGGGAAEGATAGVPAVVPATPPAAPVGAGTGLGIVPPAGRNRANSGASSPEATPTLRSAGASPLGRSAARTPAVTRPAAAVVAGENARITAARTVRNTAQRELTAAGYTPHKIRPVWLRENVSERSLPIHYNVKEGKWRGNAKEGLTFYSVYGENPENVVARYRNIKTKRNNLAAKSKALKNAEETVRQEKLAAAQATLATQKAATVERKAALKEAERIEREARKNVRSTQTLGERVKSFFGRGGSRKSRRTSCRKSCRKSRVNRKTRRAERK